MLVLCCGHPDRGDDAAGPLVARRLRDKVIGAHEHAGDALSLIDAWQGADEAVLVDAVVTGKRPGTVSTWDALAAPLAGRPRAWGMNILKADACANNHGVVLDTLRFSDRFRTLDHNPSETTRLKQHLVAAISGEL